MDGNQEPIVITGVGLTAPNGNSLAEFRKNLLAGRSGVRLFETRYLGEVPAGVCDFDETKYQTRKARRRGTRAGAISIYCAHEALADSRIDMGGLARDRAGVYIGITEHGNVETEQEVTALFGFDNNPKYWTHHHNPRTVANNPAGEVTLSLEITGPHLCLGAACAAGNVGLIHGAQQLRLGDVDVALCGGVSESIHTFGIFASFASEGALASHEDPTRASRPFDLGRNGIVVSEGGGLFVLERLADAKARGARIYGELAGYALNSDASDFVLPNPDRQEECMRLALDRAGLTPEAVDIVNTHATATKAGDAAECTALARVFGDLPSVHINNTKSLIGHVMGAAGALELAGNLPAFEDHLVHPTINVDDLDPECALPQLVIGQPKRADRVDVIQNNSSGMLGINAVVLISRHTE